jgi:putative redox protein
MNHANFNVEISLADQKVKLNGVSEANPRQPLTFDYSPPIGSGEGFAGLELLVMSFAGCVSTALLFLMKKSGANIQDFKAHVHGFRREKPLSLEKIIYEAEITSDNAQDSDIQAALEKARTMSPVWLSLSDQVVVKTVYSLKK